MRMVCLPNHTQIFDFTTSKAWFDDEGILWFISKKGPPQTMDQAKKNIRLLKEILENRKACMLIDVTYFTETTREIREYINRELETLTLAIALVSQTALGKMFANLFFNVQPRPYPIKICETIQEAKQWLTQFNEINIK